MYINFKYWPFWMVLSLLLDYVDLAHSMDSLSSVSHLTGLTHSQTLTHSQSLILSHQSWFTEEEAENRVDRQWVFTQSAHWHIIKSDLALTLNWFEMVFISSLHMSLWKRDTHSHTTTLTLTHSLTHSLTHPLTHSLAQLLARPLTHPLTNPLTHPLTCS